MRWTKSMSTFYWLLFFLIIENVFHLVLTIVFILATLAYFSFSYYLYLQLWDKNNVKTNFVLISLFAQNFPTFGVVHKSMHFECSVVLTNSLIIGVNCYFLYKNNSFIAFMGLSNYLHKIKLIFLFCQININYLVEKLKF